MAYLVMLVVMGWVYVAVDARVSTLLLRGLQADKQILATRSNFIPRNVPRMTKHFSWTQDETEFLSAD